jgi:hypothetical protein
MQTQQHQQQQLGTGKPQLQPRALLSYAASHHWYLTIPYSTAYSTDTKRSSSAKQRHRFDSRPRLPQTLEWGRHDQQQQHDGGPVDSLSTTPQQQPQQGQQLQRQQSPGGLARQQAVQIPEGELMSLIAAAGSISDIERLVLQFHTQFK